MNADCPPRHHDPRPLPTVYVESLAPGARRKALKAFWKVASTDLDGESMWLRAFFRVWAIVSWLRFCWFVRGLPVALVLVVLAPTAAHAATEAQLRAALVAGHHTAYGRAPSANRLAVAMAQVGLEVGRGRAVTCNNIGQIAAPLSAPHCVTKGGFRVRRYRSLRASAAAYWRLRAVRRALPWFDRRDVRGAALALKRSGYYTAPSAEYAARMMAVYREQQRAKR